MSKKISILVIGIAVIVFVMFSLFYIQSNEATSSSETAIAQAGQASTAHAQAEKNARATAQASLLLTVTPDVPAIQTSATYTVAAEFSLTAAAFTSTLQSPTKTSTIAYATDPTQIALGTPGELCDNFSFDSATVDVTILDGTQMLPGQDFVKTWKIKNTGICPWGDGYGLIYAGYADRMSGKPVPLGTLVAVGQEIDVSVKFKAPADKGEYTSAWQMANAKGIPFGKTIFVKIVVKADGIRLTDTSTPEATQTIILGLTQTPNPTQTFQAAFSEIDKQFENLLKGNIAFNRPEQMKKDETTSIELILSPSLSQPVLATQLIDQGGFRTSTAEPNLLIAPNGEAVTVETSQIEITQRMKAVLLSQDPEAFTVTEMHDNAEQVVSSVATTTWRWSVTAKKEGSQTLELVIYQLVISDGKDYWHEVETYKANIVVEVTPLDKIKSLDWKWIFATLLIPLAGGLWAWWKNRNKKAGVMQVEIVEKKSPPKRKK